MPAQTWAIAPSTVKAVARLLSNLEGLESHVNGHRSDVRSLFYDADTVCEPVGGHKPLALSLSTQRDLHCGILAGRDSDVLPCACAVAGHLVVAHAGLDGPGLSFLHRILQEAQGRF